MYQSLRWNGTSGIRQESLNEILTSFVCPGLSGAFKTGQTFKKKI